MFGEEEEDEKQKILPIEEHLIEYPQKNQITENHSVFTTHFFVNKYDEQCEDHAKIKEIIGLKKGKLKRVLFFFLNIVTLGIINLMLDWFPTLQLYIIYLETNIENADFVGIIGSDNKLYIEKLEKVNLPPVVKSNILLITQTNIPFSQLVYIFEYKLFKYAYDINSSYFNCITFVIQGKNNKILTTLTEGLSSNEHLYQKKIYGKCDLDIRIDSFFHLLFKEFCDPFYLFQVFSFILWIYNEYEAYAYIIMVSTIISLFAAAFETRSNLLNIKEMAKYECEVTVLRKFESKIIKQKIYSTDLVPGDVFEVPDPDQLMPCDALVIEGNVIVNEAMLTGESTPIFKTGLPYNDLDFSIKDNKKSILFAGTRIIQKRYHKNLDIKDNHSVSSRGLSVATMSNRNADGSDCTVQAIVLSTGYYTSKGNLIRSILFPKTADFKFKKDSIRYIILMAILSAVGFIISLPFLLKSGMEIKYILIRSLDLVTTTVPPALPACLSIGVSYALEKLKKHRIVCINRERVNVAGKVNLICFDKTGTLTEDKLDIAGFLPVTFFKEKITFDNYFRDCKINSERGFEHFKSKILKNKHNKSKDLNQLYIECLACCHSITRVNGKIIGDPIDVKMFESTGWTLTENKSDELISAYVRPGQEQDLEEKLEKLDENASETDVIASHYEIGLVKCFDFSSALQRMSVLVKNTNEKYFKIFVKGSPEKIKELCKAESIPENFTDVLNSYTLKGNRVLALACKFMNMNYLQSQSLQRETAEKNLIFLGFLIVQNKLKEKTTSSIQALAKAKLKMIMATGDNILTAIAVSKECGLIHPDSTVYTCGINDENSLVWETVENYTDVEKFEFINYINEVQRKIEDKEEQEIENLHEGNINTFTYHFEPETYQEDSINNHETTESLLDKKSKEETQTDDAYLLNIDLEKIPANINNVVDEDEFVFAISGKTFEILYNLSQNYIRTKDEKFQKHFTTFRLILKNCYIFARMSPEHKTMLVQCLRDEKFTVCMCGDGANDCGALKSADVGVSLSPEEASIAAHFSSEIFDISCLINLFIEGKASLVTSIQTFKYMMLYSLIQFISITFLMIEGSYLSDYQFLASDLVIIFPLAFLISLTESETHLTYHRPTGALISVPIVSSILLQTITMLFFQVFAWWILSIQNWYVNYCQMDEEDEVVSCYDNSIIFLVSNLQYLISAVAFSINHPFKKSMLTNFWLVVYLIVSFGYSVYLIISPDSFSKSLLILTNLPSKEFRWAVVGICMINFVGCYAEEKLLVPFLSNEWKKYKYEKLKKGLENEEEASSYKLSRLMKINQKETINI